MNTCILPTFKYTTKYMYLLNTCICLPLCTHELSPPRPPLRCEEAKPTSIVKYNSNTSSIHTKCTPNTRTKYAIMEVLLSDSHSDTLNTQIRVTNTRQIILRVSMQTIANSRRPWRERSIPPLSHLMRRWRLSTSSCLVGRRGRRRQSPSRWSPSRCLVGRRLAPALVWSRGLANRVVFDLYLTCILHSGDLDV